MSKELADKCDTIRSDLEKLNSEILADSRQAEFYSNCIVMKTRRITELRRALSDLTQELYEA